MIDVSSYQGMVEWEKVHAAGQRYVYVKASEGVHITDGMFGPNIRGAREAGLTVGVYHYAHPANAPHREAATFLKTASPHMRAGDLRPALDLEVTEGHDWAYLNDWKAQFLAVVDQHIGALSVFYSYWYFWKQMKLYAARPVWGAYVGGTLPAGTDWNVWQYSFTGSVDGVRGLVDLDRLLTPPPLIP